MDALRRAEEDKRRAAERAEQPAVASGGAATSAEDAARQSPASVSGGQTAESLPAGDIGAATQALPELSLSPPSPAPATFSLEPLPEKNVRPQRGGLGPGGGLEDLDSPDPVQPGSTTIERALAALGLGDMSGGQHDPEVTRESHRPREPSADATLPSERVLKGALHEFFDASQSMEAGQAASGDGTAPTLQRESGGVTSPTRADSLDVAPQVVDHRSGRSQRVTAQAVLSAVHRKTSTQLYSLLIVGLFLVAAALGAVGFYYHARTLSPPPYLPMAAQVAAGVERPAPPVPARELPPVVAPQADGEAVVSAAASTAPAVPAVPDSGVSLAAGAETGTAPPLADPSLAQPGQTGIAAATVTDAAAPVTTLPPIDGQPRLAAVAPPQAVATPSPQPAPVAVAPSPPAPPPSPLPTAATAPGTPAPSPAAPIAATEALVAAAPPLVSAEGLPIATAVRITRSPAKASIAPGLMDAYAAWRRGDLAVAESAYREVLASRPTERDALLGLAGVAVARGQARKAVQLYERVLELDPRDSVASAGLHLLQGGDGPGLDAANLELLLDEEPAAAHLHFALGNHHARMQRWADAQAAYFDAWRLEVDNPDYAFNLAVALDQLGQTRAAAEYYQRALTNAAPSGRRYSFNRADVEARLRGLRSVGKS